MTGTASMLTPAGRGAVAVIALDVDPEAFCGMDLFRPANGKRIADAANGRLIYGDWGRAEPYEDLVLARVTESRWEVHCHGGSAATARVLSDLHSQGVQLVDADQWLSRECSVIEGEIRSALSLAVTVRTARLILSQLDGRLEQAFRSLHDLVALANTGWQAEVARIADSILRWEPVSRMLIRPARVVLYGQPNVGKSSLINAIVGYGRAIVFDEPGTTRDVVTAETALEGWPVQLSDTAGLRETDQPLEAAGIQRAEQALHSADLKLCLIDRSMPASTADDRLLARHKHRIVVAHKSDLDDRRGPELPGDAIPVSSVTREGLDLLFRRVVDELIPETPPSDAVIAVSDRQLILLHSLVVASAESDHSTCAKLLS